MTQEQWTAVDHFINAAIASSDPVLEAALEDSLLACLPAINVTPAQGKLLMLLARIRGARNILEIGTLGGYSTIWLARALPADGRLITLEADPRHAAVARANLARAGVEKRVELRVGRALETLPLLSAEGRGPFDFVFIDADKASTPDYFVWALKLSRPGTIIIADNVVRAGAVLEQDSPEANIQGVRRFYDLIAAERRVSATVIQTVGSKGHDGFALALVLDGS